MDLQTLILWFGMALVGLGVAGGGALALGELRVRSLRKARFQDPAAPTAQPARGEVRILGQITASVRRLGQQAAISDPSKVSDVRMRLIRAGFFGKEAAIYYLGARAAALAAATLGVIVMLPFALKPGHGMAPVLLAAILALIALLGPDQVLSLRQKDREREYADGFPDLLDLLVASVEAGLSLDAAVGRVTDELVRRYPRLTIHLRMLTLELRAGKSRKDAWTAFADRLGIDDARAFATMLRQAEDMGTSLGETLSVFSQDMRQKRMLRAEEKALALPVKLTVPLILFIFPCLLGVLLLPAAFRLMQVFN